MHPLLNKGKTLSELSKLESKILWLCARYIWVSSAYRLGMALKLEMILLRGGGSVKGKKEGNQDRTLGTPQGSLKASELLFPGSSSLYWCGIQILVACHYKAGNKANIYT